MPSYKNSINVLRELGINVTEGTKEDFEVASGYYGALAAQSPRNTVALMSIEQQANMAAQQMAHVSDKYKSDIQKRIDEYNAKYAGKNKEEVDRQERRDTELRAKGLVRISLGEFIQNGRHGLPIEDKFSGGADEEASFVHVVAEEFHEPATIEPTHVFHTAENTYCGVHNTVDSGGCHVCKEHSK